MTLEGLGVGGSKTEVNTEADQHIVKLEVSDCTNQRPHLPRCCTSGFCKIYFRQYATTHDVKACS